MLIYIILNVYVCFTGEGAGYAGGIVSAAVDGAKVGREVIIMIEGGVRKDSEAKSSLYIPAY